MRNKTPITSVENLESVLEILKVLIREGIQQAQGYPGGPIQRRAQETEETIEEQGWLARIVHLIQGKDNDTQFKVSDAALVCKVRTLTGFVASSISSQSILRRQRASQVHHTSHHHSISQACAAIQETGALRRQLAITIIGTLQVHAQHPLHTVQPCHRLRRPIAAPIHLLWAGR